MRMRKIEMNGNDIKRMKRERVKNKRKKLEKGKLRKEKCLIEKRIGDEEEKLFIMKEIEGRKEVKFRENIIRKKEESKIWEIEKNWIEKGRKRKEVEIGEKKIVKIKGRLGNVNRRRKDEERKDLSRREIEKLIRGERMLDMEVENDENEVGKSNRIEMIVGKIEESRMKIGVKIIDLGENMSKKFGIEVRERIIEEKELRVEKDGEKNGEKMEMEERKMRGEEVNKWLKKKKRRRIVEEEVDLRMRMIWNIKRKKNVIE